MNLKQALSLSPDAPVLLAHVLNKNKAWLFAHPEFELPRGPAAKFEKLIKKRRAGRPAAYLTGRKEFCGLDFLVNKDVLIPRPETELLVELALSILPSPLAGEGSRVRGWNIIDVGTGSGNIIISLAKKIPAILKPACHLPAGEAGTGRRSDRISFFATDISRNALAVARGNARRHGVAKKIKFLRGNLLSSLLHSSFTIHHSLFIANLPYGWKAWKNNTSAETAGLKFEPQNALFTKDGGLHLIKRLLKQIAGLPRHHPRENGNEVAVLLEFDPRQKKQLQSFAKKLFPKAKITFHRDLAGRWRAMEITI